MFAYSVPWPAETALDQLQGTRLVAVGKGWTVTGDASGIGRSLVHREGFLLAESDPALRRQTPEGWTYHGHRKPLAEFRRKRAPLSVEFETVRGIRVLVPLAELSPQAVDFATGESIGHADAWAARAWAAHDARENFSRDGVAYWRLTGPMLDAWTTLFLCIQATHAVSVEALTDTRDLTTADLANAFSAIWGYGDAGK